MKYWIKISAVLFLLWMAFSEQYNIKFLSIGLVSSMLVSYLCLPLFFDEDTGEFILPINWIDFIKYFVWLLKEIAVATIMVGKIIVRREKNTEAQICKFKCSYDHPMAKAFLISSIILTPGTVTVNITEGEIYHVHAISQEFADNIKAGIMQKKIKQLFGEEI